MGAEDETGDRWHPSCPACEAQVETPSQPVCADCGFQAESPDAWEFTDEDAVSFGSVDAGIVGKERRPWLVILLMFVTLGLYGFYWIFVVFKEVDEQSGQSHHSGLYVASLILSLFGFGGLLLLVYGGLEMKNLQRAKRKAGIPEGMGQSGYYGMVVGLFFLISIVLFSGLVLILSAASIEGFVLWLVAVAGSLLVFSIVPPMVIQYQVNHYWRGLQGAGIQGLRGHSPDANLEKAEPHRGSRTPRGG